MIDAERQLKQYFRKQNDNSHKISWHYKKNVLRLDDAQVAHRLSDCAVVWDDHELYNKVHGLPAGDEQM